MGANDTDNNGREGFAEGPEGDVPMSFLEHIGVLRKRLMRAVAAVVLGSIGAFFFVDELTAWLKQPLVDAWANSGQEGLPSLQALSMQAPVMVDFWVAFVAGFAFSLPVVFYQLWSFIAPGLYVREKRFVIPFVSVSVVMFAIGAAFAYLYVIPFIYQFFIEYAGEGELVQPELSSYYKGTCMVLVAFGVVFELPLLAAFLAKFELVTERTLLKAWKFAVIAIFIVAGLLTPPEPISQLMMAIPMVTLYFISVGVAWLINPAAKSEPGPGKRSHSPRGPLAGSRARTSVDDDDAEDDADDADDADDEDVDPGRRP